MSVTLPPDVYDHYLSSLMPKATPVMDESDYESFNLTPKRRPTLGLLADGSFCVSYKDGTAYRNYVLAQPDYGKMALSLLGSRPIETREDAAQPADARKALEVWYNLCLDAEYQFSGWDECGVYKTVHVAACN